MNRFEIREILNAHKEHFRVLPDAARNGIQSIIQAIDDDKEQERLLTEKEWGKLKAMNQEAISIRETAEKRDKEKPVKKESPAGSFTVGKVAKKKAKKKSR